MIGGIGSGKSYAGCVKAFVRASERKVLLMVTAPTYPMLRDATLRTFMDMAGPFVRDFYKSEMIATLVNGSEVLFRSTENPDRLRGPNLHGWFGDEAGEII
jgi:phage terminase large subunit-like protein